MTMTEAAIENSRAAVLATRGQEAWKYTNLVPLLEGSWEAAEAFDDNELPARTVFPSYDGDKSGEIVLLNGRLVKQWSNFSLPNVTVRLTNETEALALAAPMQAKLNHEFARDVLRIEFTPDTILKKPLVISNFYFGTESLTKWSVAALRVVISVAPGCEVALVEMTAGEGRAINLPVTSISVAQGSRLSHARFNLSQEAGAQLGYTQIALARDAFAETYQFTLGGRLSREDLAIRLDEPGAEVVLDGLYLANGKRHVDHSTSVDHLAPHTTSSQLYKGILTDESRAVFNGRVHIHRVAQQSVASQLNNNLILSKRAEIDTKPELEIDADDVKASHGATIGQIDPEHVFYLRARAISEKDAVQMLSKGFAQDVAFRIQNEFICNAAEKIVAKALAKNESQTDSKAEAPHG